MSIKAIAWALEQKTGSPGAKLVLIKLADNANDSGGSCFPSQETVSRETELSVRAIRDHLRRLEEGRFIQTTRRPNQSNLYQLNVGSAKSAEPDRRNLPVVPAKSAGLDRRELPPNRHIEPSIEPSEKKEAARVEVVSAELPEWLPLEPWEAFKQHRKTIKAPLTARAERRAIQKLDAFRAQGEDVAAVLDQTTDSGKWTDLYAVRKDTGGPGRGYRSKADVIREQTKRALEMTYDDGPLFQSGVGDSQKRLPC